MGQKCLLVVTLLRHYSSGLHLLHRTPIQRKYLSFYSLQILFPHLSVYRNTVHRI